MKNRTVGAAIFIAGLIILAIFIVFCGLTKKIGRTVQNCYLTLDKPLKLYFPNLDSDQNLSFQIAWNNESQDQHNAYISGDEFTLFGHPVPIILTYQSGVPCEHNFNNVVLQRRVDSSGLKYVCTSSNR